MTRLTYLTVEQIQIIEAADLHNSNIGFEHHYGPQNIPSYNGGQGDAAQGDAVDSSNSNTGSPDPSAAMAALDSGFGGWGIGSPGNLGGYSTIGGFIPGTTPEEQAARMCLAAQYANPPLAAFGGGDGGGCDGGPGTGVPFFPTIGPNSGVYSGSLSSLGNMVAMALGTG